jgi:hypothetical protein
VASSTTVDASANYGYIVNSSGVEISLPDGLAGDEVDVAGEGFGFSVVVPAGNIVVGTRVLFGSGGSALSAGSYLLLTGGTGATVDLVADGAGNWVVVSAVGAFSGLSF